MSRLSSTQVSTLRARLKERLTTLVEAIRRELIDADAERYADLAGRVHDPGDESVADLLVDVKLAEIDRHVAGVREVEAGLLRLARGTYGVCIDCGSEIGYERLETEPTALRCRECQQRFEHRYAQPGRATL